MKDKTKMPIDWRFKLLGFIVIFFGLLYLSGKEIRLREEKEVTMPEYPAGTVTWGEGLENASCKQERGYFSGVKWVPVSTLLGTRQELLGEDGLIELDAFLTHYLGRHFACNCGEWYEGTLICNCWKPWYDTRFEDWTNLGAEFSCELLKNEP